MADTHYHACQTRAFGRPLPVPAAARLQVLHVTVRCADAWKVRQAIAGCAGARVVRCQVMMHERAAKTDGIAPRVRLMVGLPPSSYLAVLHALMQAVPWGELGVLVTWREHLRRCGLKRSAS